MQPSKIFLHILRELHNKIGCTNSAYMFYNRISAALANDSTFPQSTHRQSDVLRFMANAHRPNESRTVRRPQTAQSSCATCRPYQVTVSKKSLHTEAGERKANTLFYKQLKVQIKHRKLRTLILSSSSFLHIKNLSALRALVIPLKV